MAHPSGGYKNHEGIRVPGTTTIGGRFKDSGALIMWAYKQGREHENLAARGLPAPSRLYESVEEAASIGTTAHSMVEAHINGEEPDEVLGQALKAVAKDKRDEYAKAATSSFKAYRAWERMTNLEIVAQEVQLVSEEHQFGGTPDAVGKIEGELCLVDWKTSNSVYPEMLLQLAAYKHLVERGFILGSDGKATDEQLGMELTGGFHLCRFAKEHGDFAHHYYPDLSEAWEQFKRFRAAYETDKQLKKRAA